MEKDSSKRESERVILSEITQLNKSYCRFVSICCVSHRMRQCLPRVARRRVSPAGRSSAVMSTSILPVKAGAKDLVRIGADKRTTSC